MAIFKDYTTYVNNLNLSDESKNIQAIIVKNTESPESIKAYVNTFSEINTERTRITNTPETDGYFLVETEIRGLPFRFRIRGVEKYLENIEYLDASGTSQIFRGGVSLVEREKLVKEQVG